MQNDSQLPSATYPVTERSLPNGTVLDDYRRKAGIGRLKLKNNGYDDAVVTVKSDTNELRHRVYIKHDCSLTVTHLPPGAYSVVFATGRDWNGEDFNQGPDYLVFGKKLEFEEVQEADGTRYRAFEITLQAAPDGTVKPVRLSREEYLRLVANPIAEAGR